MEYFAQEKYNQLIEMMKRNTKRYNDILMNVSYKLLPKRNIKLAKDEVRLQINKGNYFLIVKCHKNSTK